MSKLTATLRRFLFQTAVVSTSLVLVLGAVVVAASFTLRRPMDGIGASLAQAVSLLKDLSDVSDSLAPTSGQVLSYNGSQWTATTPTTGGAALAGARLGGAATQTTNFTISEPGIVIVQGDVVSSRAGSCVFAQNTVTIAVNGVDCAVDNDFLVTLCNGGMNSSATCILPVPAGTHSLSVTPLLQNMSLVDVRLGYVVVKAP